MNGLNNPIYILMTVKMSNDTKSINCTYNCDPKHEQFFIIETDLEMIWAHTYRNYVKLAAKAFFSSSVVDYCRLTRVINFFLQKQVGSKRLKTPAFCNT